MVEGELVGGYLPLARVYDYNPADGFDDTKHLLGLQGNLWTEHVPTEENFEYKTYPRAFALAEVGWTPQELRSFDEFRPRAVALADYIRTKGYNAFDLHTEMGERPEMSKALDHLARGCKVTYNLPYSNHYPAEGDETLTNGLQGGWSYVDGRWQGFLNDLDVTVDLGQKRHLGFVGAHFLANLGVWIGFPVKMQILGSDDGINFVEITQVLCQVKASDSGAMYLLLGAVVNADARYVRFKANRSGRLHEDWLFVDEIIIK